MKAVIAIIAVLIIAGGGYALVKNNDNKTPAKTAQGTSSNMDNMKSSGSSTAPEATNSVEISNMAFGPASITVKKGATVTWTNKDSIAHTVTGDSQDGPASKSLANGDTYSFTFNSAGTFKYHCSIHSSMTGTVTVTE